MMVAGPPGMTAGGVSGGCLEEYIARHGRELTREQPAAVIGFDTGNGEDDAKPVLGCGGSIDVLVERLTADHLAMLQELQAAYDGDDPAILTTTFDGRTVNRSWQIDGAFAKLAGRALADQRSYFTPSPQGGEGEGGAVDLGAARYADERGTFRPSPQPSPLRAEGARRTLVHYIPPVTRLVVFGAGDDVQPLVRLAYDLGWHVTIADRRGRKATAGRFPSADAVLAEPWDAAIARIRFTPTTAVLLMTHSLPDDAELLPLLAGRDAAYLGVLGPSHRLANLLALVDQPVLAARVHGPIGLDLGDRSPAGIAVAVTAEILAHLNDRQAVRLSGMAERPARERAG
jgi:xanthine dehydrogenase accessory factor